MITLKQLVTMKPTALLINCSRGGIVNEADLVEALKGGVIAGAGTDVYCSEPPKADDPLLHCPNLVLSPPLCRSNSGGRHQNGSDVRQGLPGSVPGREVALCGG